MTGTLNNTNESEHTYWTGWVRYVVKAMADITAVQWTNAMAYAQYKDSFKSCVARQLYRILLSARTATDNNKVLKKPLYYYLIDTAMLHLPFNM